MATTVVISIYRRRLQILLPAPTLELPLHANSAATARSEHNHRQGRHFGHHQLVPSRPLVPPRRDCRLVRNACDPSSITTTGDAPYTSAELRTQPPIIDSPANNHKQSDVSHWRPDRRPPPSNSNINRHLPTDGPISAFWVGRRSTTDLVPGETTEALLPYIAPAATVVTIAAAPAEWRVIIKPTVNAAVATRLVRPLELMARENVVVTSLLLATVGTIALQGCSLMNTAHHYISDSKNQSHKAFAAVEKQSWKSSCYKNNK